MQNLLDLIEKINVVVNNIVWGPVMLAFLMFVGVYFSIRLRWFQLVHVKLWIKKTVGEICNNSAKKQKSSNGGISSFQAMTTALAGSIGTGNIVGVATAITLGGPGSVFWMWAASIVGMMTIFAENILGMKYRCKNSKGQPVGGPMYYIERGLGKRWLAVFFSIACTLAAFGMGNMAQSNSIAGALNQMVGIEPRYSGIIVASLVLVIIFGGVNRIAKVTEKVVPFMSMFYIVGGLVVIFSNATIIPEVFSKIFKSAFDFKCVIGGVGGFGVYKAMKYGISRGVFSNEAGLGSSPIIYAAVDEEEPVVQGMWGIFQVFFDTILGCTITALCILCTGVVEQGKDGVELSISAFESVFGNWGATFVSISIILFAFSTLVGWSYYGERAVEYITSDWGVVIYKAVYIVIIMFGSVMNLRLVWDISDTFNGLMAIPNLIALMFLSNEIIKEVKEYKSRNKEINK